jgi:predicted RNA binding protein YcfA (HicA-like mRNA interferase family)
MNPQDQLIKLLRENSFNLVRQRKHKIYRNPEGRMFVISSTPSDRQAPQNALSTLKRVLRQGGAADEFARAKPTAESVSVTEPVPVIEGAKVVEPVSIEPSPAIEPAAAPVSDQEWEAWKLQYWHDEKLRAKNERFLSEVNTYVGRVSELMHEKLDKIISPANAADAIKSLLREMDYKSKVVLYKCTFFDQGIVDLEIPDHPILWASNGHIGISAFIYLNAYIQHDEPLLRPASLRFSWDGIPVLFELPEKGRRKFHVGEPTK